MDLTANVAYWDDQASSVEAARFAVWAADGWDEGIAETLDVLTQWLGPLRPRPRLLDLGCGCGRLALPAAREFGAEVLAVDPSWRMLEAAQVEARSLSLSVGSVLWYANDGRTLPDAVEHLDGGWSVLCFQHLPDDVVAGYLAQLPARLKPGARFVAQFALGDGRGPHCYEWTVSEVASLVEGSHMRLVAIECGRMQPNWAWAVLAS